MARRRSARGVRPSRCPRLHVRRPDRALKISGAPIANLVASTTGTDSDWVVKLIDVYPDEVAGQPALGGYQLMVSADIFRGRYRESFEKPARHRGRPAPALPLRASHANHVFLPGHRIMVQVQSSWFPLYDRNPQTFVPNIFWAKPQDYRKAAQRIYHAPGQASFVELPVVSRPDGVLPPRRVAGRAGPPASSSISTAPSSTPRLPSSRSGAPHSGSTVTTSSSTSGSTRWARWGRTIRARTWPSSPARTSTTRRCAGRSRRATRPDVSRSHFFPGWWSASARRARRGSARRWRRAAPRSGSRAGSSATGSATSSTPSARAITCRRSSPPPTSSSSPPAASRPPPRPAWPSRTHPTASGPRAPPGCRASRSPTL